MDGIKDLAAIIDKGDNGGVYLVRPTGKVLEGDGIFLEVIITGQNFYAKPCMMFGSFIIPDAEWIAKYKDEIMVWVAFENGNPAHPVYLGVCPLEDTIGSTPEEVRPKTWKSVYFDWSFNDITKTFLLRQKDDDDNFVRGITIGDKSLVLNDSDNNSITMGKSGIVATSGNGQSLKLTTETTLGGGEGLKTAVLGEDLQSILTELLTQISLASVVVDGAPVPLTNAEAFTPIIGKLESILSESVKLD